MYNRDEYKNEYSTRTSRSITNSSVVADMPPHTYTNVFARRRQAFITYSQHLTPSNYQAWKSVWCRKSRMAELQSCEGRIMIDSVVWAQYFNVTDTQTATSRDRHTDSHVTWQTHRQPRHVTDTQTATSRDRHTDSHVANAMASGGKNVLERTRYEVVETLI